MNLGGAIVGGVQQVVGNGDDQRDCICLLKFQLIN